nr:MAG TPA: hypothetical protein [Caudoviricetes sp.]
MSSLFYQNNRISISLLLFHQLCYKLSLFCHGHPLYPRFPDIY